MKSQHRRRSGRRHRRPGRRVPASVSFSVFDSNIDLVDYASTIRLSRNRGDTSTTLTDTEIKLTTLLQLRSRANLLVLHVTDQHVPRGVPKYELGQVGILNSELRGYAAALRTNFESGNRARLVKLEPQRECSPSRRRSLLRGLRSGRHNRDWIHRDLGFRASALLRHPTQWVLRARAQTVE